MAESGSSSEGYGSGRVQLNVVKSALSRKTIPGYINTHATNLFVQQTHLASLLIPPQQTEALHC